jgi:transcriptional regulator GlxA family with amidase domain
METSFATDRAEHQIRGGLADWQLRKVIRHVDEHLGTSLACEDLAALVRLSTGHFCRAFKSSVGEPPHTYLIRQRIQRAQRLMVETRDSLSQIACACGLTDQAHLTRLFRKSVGTTPRAWRVHRLAAVAA